MAARLEAIGPDRATWPATAREEAERLDAKAAALAAAVSDLQTQLENEAGRARVEVRTSVSLLDIG